MVSAPDHRSIEFASHLIITLARWRANGDNWTIHKAHAHVRRVLPLYDDNVDLEVALAYAASQVVGTTTDPGGWLETAALVKAREAIDALLEQRESTIRANADVLASSDETAHV